MPTFSSSAELKAYILSRSYTAVNNATNTAHDILEEKVDAFYRSEPDYYLRTDRLRSSLTNPVVTGSGNGVEGEVHFDEGKLDYRQGLVPINNPPLPNGYEEGLAEYSGIDVLNAAMTGDPGELNWTNNTAIWNKSVPTLRDKMYDEIKEDLIAVGIPIS